MHIWRHKACNAVCSIWAAVATLYTSVMSSCSTNGSCSATVSLHQKRVLDTMMNKCWPSVKLSKTSPNLHAWACTWLQYHCFDAMRYHMKRVLHITMRYLSTLPAPPMRATTTSPLILFCTSACLLGPSSTPLGQFFRALHRLWCHTMFGLVYVLPAMPHHQIQDTR